MRCLAIRNSTHASIGEAQLSDLHRQYIAAHAMIDGSFCGCTTKLRAKINMRPSRVHHCAGKKI